ncbi:MAG: zf-HC2 domain-containing protein [Thermoleophilaceae bacterium]
MTGPARRLRAKRDHRWSRRRIHDYVDGELSSRQQRRLEAHARLCPRCGPMLRTLTVLVWELRELGGRRPRSAVASGVVERLRAEAGDPGAWRPGA